VNTKRPYTAFILPLLLLLLPLFAAVPTVTAHEVRPAYLELRQTDVDTYDVLWKVPARGEGMRLGLYVRFPQTTANLSEPRGMFAGGAYLERWSIRHPDGLSGQTIHIDGLTASATDVLVRLQRLDGSDQVARLVPTSPSLVIEATPDFRQVAQTYLLLGVEHILLGFDHLLFVLALLFLLSDWRKLLLAITAFTVAHSLTLAAATFGVIHMPGPPVEVCIALSIAFIAAEIVHRRRGRMLLSVRWPWLVAFAFGLLHGLGFAGALSELGLPAGHIPLALLFFNLGVEAGQLLFIIVVLPVIALFRSGRIMLWRGSELVVPYAIGTVAMFWVIERIVAFAVGNAAVANIALSL
jgi:hydrogenase/urease accessory protein HupE